MFRPYGDEDCHRESMPNRVLSTPLDPSKVALVEEARKVVSDPNLQTCRKATRPRLESCLAAHTDGCSDTVASMTQSHGCCRSWCTQPLTLPVDPERRLHRPASLPRSQPQEGRKVRNDIDCAGHNE